MVGWDIVVNNLIVFSNELNSGGTCVCGQCQCNEGFSGEQCGCKEGKTCALDDDGFVCGGPDRGVSASRFLFLQQIRIIHCFFLII